MAKKPTKPPKPTTNISITVPKDLLAIVDGIVEGGEHTRSSWIVQAAIKDLPPDLQTTLQPRQSRGRPKSAK